MDVSQEGLGLDQLTFEFVSVHNKSIQLLVIKTIDAGTIINDMPNVVLSNNQQNFRMSYNLKC